MKRGEIWTIVGGSDYSGKPRPAVILQDDRFDGTDSLTICPFTTDPADLPLFRLAVAPSPANGLRFACRLMVDKISTVRRTKLGDRLGRLTAADMVRLNRAIVVFIGIAGSPDPVADTAAPAT